MGHLPKAVFDRLVEVARRNPHWTFLMSSIDPKMRSSLTPPENVVLTEWAPQLDVLEICDCAIFHGGAGTLNECLATKTPMLIFPNALDGKGNGARTVFHGTGIMGSYSDSIEQIEEKIEYLCTAESVRDSLRRQNEMAFETNCERNETPSLTAALQQIMNSSA